MREKRPCFHGAYLTSWGKLKRWAKNYRMHVNLFCLPVSPFYDWAPTGYDDLRQGRARFAWLQQLPRFRVAICSIALPSPGVQPVRPGQAGCCSPSSVLNLRAKCSPFHSGNVPGVPRKFPSSSSPPLCYVSYVYSKNVYVHWGQAGQWSTEPQSDLLG